MVTDNKNYDNEEVTYEESFTDDPHTDDIEETPVKKSKSKNINLIIYSVIILLVGFVGYQMFAPMLFKARPVARQQLTPTPVEVAPVEVPIAEVVPPMPTDVPPVVEPVPVAVDVPVLGDVAAVGAVAVVEPMAVDTAVVKVNVSEEIVAEIKNNLNTHTERLTNLESRVGELEVIVQEKVLADISALQAKLETAKKTGVYKKIAIKNRKSVSRSAVDANPKSTFKVEYGDDVAKNNMNSTEDIIVDNTLRANSNSQIQAIIVGRVWMKDAEGNSHTYIEGDTLPDGRIIKKINVDKDRIETSGGMIN